MVRNWRREPAGRARRGISAILLLLLFVCFVGLGVSLCRCRSCCCNPFCLGNGSFVHCISS